MDYGEQGSAYSVVVSPGNDGFLSEFFYLGGDDDLTQRISQTYDVDCDRLLNVAYTVQHEMTHQMLRKDLSTQVPIDFWQITPTNDNDYVHDTVRENKQPYWLCPDIHDTYDMDSILSSFYSYPWRSDQEFMTFMSEMEGPKSVNENIDWSKDGRLWQK